VREEGGEEGREGGKAYLALAVLLEEGLEVLVQAQLEHGVGHVTD